jgi:fermentation-respiration switch protein FrsA (DUF1100 family)
LTTALLPAGRSLMLWGTIAIAGLIALKLLVLLAEPHLTFMPVRDLTPTPADLGLPFEDIALTTDDGETVHGWFIPAGIPASDRPPPTIVHFHGNAENIAPYSVLGRLTRNAGFNLLLVDYRGYGRSSGRPSEAGIYRDGEAALRFLRSRPGIDTGRIIVWGRSIGACVAVHLAASDDGIAGLVLESSFTTARELLWHGGAIVLYPLSFLATYRFDQKSKIAGVTAPVLFVHGTDDRIAPFRLGRRLHDLAPGPKTFLTIEGGGHNDLLARHADTVWSGVREFVESLH